MGAEIVCHYLQDKGEVKRDTSKTFLHFYERLVEYSYFAVSTHKQRERERDNQGGMSIYFYMQM